MCTENCSNCSSFSVQLSLSLRERFSNEQRASSISYWNHLQDLMSAPPVPPRVPSQDVEKVQETTSGLSPEVLEALRSKDTRGGAIGTSLRFSISLLSLSLSLSLTWPTTLASTHT